MTAAANIYHNLSGLESLRVEARSQSADGVDKVARQFESLFVQMMLKSMRDATPKGGLFESDQMDMYQQMFDQQISLDLSQQGGIGMADTLREQLGGDGRATGKSPAAGLMEDLASYRLRALPVRDFTPRETPGVAAAAAKGDRWQPASPEEFVREVWELARSSAQDLGVDPRVLVAQSALETGWGKQVIRDQQGRSSYNLFGIKADARWEGEAVTVSTLEYRDNIARPEKAQFRRYDSLADSFNDYVDFLRRNPRYEHALANSSDSKAFLAELQSAGYATDPAYADKVMAVLSGLQADSAAP